jgi:hypothetical protein
MSYEEDLSVFEEPEEDFVALMLGDQKPRERNEVVWEWWAGVLPPGNALSYDLESDYDWTTKAGGDNVIQVSVSDGKKTIVARTPETVREVLEALTQARAYGKVLVGHNSWNYDRGMAQGFLDAKT